MSQSKVLAAMLPVVATLEDLGIDYYIGGAVASLVHGTYRTTADVDIIAEMRPEHVRAFVERLQDTYYVDADMIKDALRRRSEFNVIHLATMFKVDIFFPKHRPFDQMVRQRVQERDLHILDEHTLIRTESPEDVILSKLEWFQMGGRVSTRQWGDILGVLRVQQHLDLAYLRHWANELHLTDLLTQALQEADIL